jgi:hypothetical protein
MRTLFGHFGGPLLVVVACIAQQPTRNTIAACGFGSGHECRCLERTERIQRKIIAACQSAGSKKQITDCVHEHMQDHCALAETMHPLDGEDMHWDASTQEYTGKSEMGVLCSMACKKHDCKCDDGPTCHYGHDVSEHDEK